jgi:DNA-3-methyladenine glycosylase I
MEHNPRCGWCGTEEIYVRYHDEVWGRADYNSQSLFKKLCLDGQQAGLSWITILKRQSGYEEVFFDFDPEAIATLVDDDIENLMQDTRIIRNRAKIKSIVNNAKAFLAYERLHGIGSFSDFLWSFVDGKPTVNYWQNLSQVPAETEVSKAMSKQLKKLGFSFVGPTICYAFMQAVGMVNDHLVTCPAYQSCQ